MQLRFDKWHKTAAKATQQWEGDDLGWHPKR